MQITESDIVMRIEYALLGKVSGIGEQCLSGGTGMMRTRRRAHFECNLRHRRG